MVEPKSTPPLGIRHLLLWTACSAVLWTGHFAITRLIEAKLEMSMGEQKYFDGARAIIEGPAVAALLIWMARKRRGVRFPVQPGEWLLVIAGIMALSFLAGMTLWCLYPRDQGNRILLLPMALIALGYLLAALWPPLPKWWRVALLAMSALWGVELGQHLAYAKVDLSGHWFDLIPHLYLLSLIVPIGVILVCAAIDRAKHIERGWLHWTGVAVCLANLLLGLAQHAYYQWIRG